MDISSYEGSKTMRIDITSYPKSYTLRIRYIFEKNGQSIDTLGEPYPSSY